MKKKLMLLSAAALLAVLTPVAVIAATSDAPAQQEAKGPIYCDPDAYPNCI